MLINHSHFHTIKKIFRNKRWGMNWLDEVKNIWLTNNYRSDRD